MWQNRQTYAPRSGPRAAAGAARETRRRRDQGRARRRHRRRPLRFRLRRDLGRRRARPPPDLRAEPAGVHRSLAVRPGRRAGRGRQPVHRRGRRVLPGRPQRLLRAAAVRRPRLPGTGQALRRPLGHRRDLRRHPGPARPPQRPARLHRHRADPLRPVEPHHPRRRARAPRRSATPTPGDWTRRAPRSSWRCSRRWSRSTVERVAAGLAVVLVMVTLPLLPTGVPVLVAALAAPAVLLVQGLRSGRGAEAPPRQAPQRRTRPGRAAELAAPPRRTGHERLDRDRPHRRRLLPGQVPRPARRPPVYWSAPSSSGWPHCCRSPCWPRSPLSRPSATARI